MCWNTIWLVLPGNWWGGTLEMITMMAGGAYSPTWRRVWPLSPRDLLQSPDIILPANCPTPAQPSSEKESDKGGRIDKKWQDICIMYFGYSKDQVIPHTLTNNIIRNKSFIKLILLTSTSNYTFCSFEIWLGKLYSS